MKIAIERWDDAPVIKEVGLVDWVRWHIGSLPLLDAGEHNGAVRIMLHYDSHLIRIGRSIFRGHK